MDRNREIFTNSDSLTTQSRSKEIVMTERRLYRSRTNRVIWGVCGGLAKYLDIDPTIIRIIAVLLIFANGIGILAYIVMAIIIPVEGSSAKDPRETTWENTDEMKKTVAGLGQEIRSTFCEKEIEAEDLSKARQQRRKFAGIAVIAIGVLALAANFHSPWWLNWGRLWPLIIVAAGLLLIFKARGRHSD